MVRTDLTQEIVKELLAYNPASGKLTWRHRSRRWLPEPKSHLLWNAAHAGQPAFTTKTADGSLRGKLCNRTYLAHRIIWLYVTGEWPDLEIDHINRRPWDNRFSNLRHVTGYQNQRNQALHRNNKSGYPGVHWRPKLGKYLVRIGPRYVGVYPTKLQAIAARAAANKLYGYAAGHGRARLLSNQERMRT